MRLQDLIACSGLHRPDSDVAVSSSNHASDTTRELGATRGEGHRKHRVPAQKEKVSTGNSGEFTSTVARTQGERVSSCTGD